nr:hypothetical protein [uncultured Oscillibacter sp.]
MELDFSNFVFFDVPKECVLKKDIIWAVQRKEDGLTAEIKLYQGMIAQYDDLKADHITIYFTDISLSVTQEQFDQLANALPRPPAGLIYQTFDDAFILEDKPFWIYDIESGAFLDASVFPSVMNDLDSCVDISETYCQERYGISWMVLTKK